MGIYCFSGKKKYWVYGKNRQNKRCGTSTLQFNACKLERIRNIVIKKNTIMEMRES